MAIRWEQSGPSDLRDEAAGYVGVLKLFKVMPYLGRWIMSTTLPVKIPNREYGTEGLAKDAAELLLLRFTAFLASHVDITREG